MGVIKQVRECYDDTTKFLSSPGLLGFPTLIALPALTRLSFIHSTNTIWSHCDVPEDAKNRASKNTEDMGPALRSSPSHRRPSLRTIDALLEV